MILINRRLLLLAMACIGLQFGAAANIHSRAGKIHGSAASDLDGSNASGQTTALAPQIMNHVDKRLSSTIWKSYWIGVPNENPREYGVRLFRKKIALAAQDLNEPFVVHVSADERYKLYVNGREVSDGPARGDQLNWKFETIDLRPYLHEGDNVLCATVWFFGTSRPVAQMTYGECGFLMQGDTPREDVVNTDGSWRCMTNPAYSICRAGKTRGYFCVGPNEQVDMAKFPHGWLSADFDDSGWKHAYGQFRAAMRGYPDYGFRLLTPRTIPQMEKTSCQPMVVRQLQTASDTTNYPLKSAKIFSGTSVAANSRTAILLDQQELVTGYLNLSLSGGKGSTVTVGYAETLFNKQADGSLLPLSNRNEVEGKVFLGCKDRILCDGTADFCFTPLWWRTWRYVLLEIETKDEPLTINNICGVTSMYPFERVSTLTADEDPQLAQMLDVGWRTARLCANETYMDCPYYEQLQYFGDTRIQAMVTMFSTRDSLMLRQALETGQQSMVAEGLTRSRYPSSFMQIISSYSLSWSGMVYDYWMHRDDPVEVKRMLPSIRRVLAWYEQFLRPDGSLDKIPFWFFCDWAAGFDYGVPPRRADGYSAYQDLALLMALDEAAAMEHALGIEGMALHYESLAKSIRAHFIEHYWDESRQLFADTKDKNSFSQHTNIMAVICGILPQGQDTELCRKILEDKSLTQATIYFRYYLFAAMKKAGLADKFLDELGIWRQQLSEGMTTWAETPAPTRSDCHAWGASPNVELFRCVMGISSEAPGFSKVRIAPALGKLKRISGTMPHPKGTISVSLEVLPSGKLRKQISVPQGVECEFVWQGKTEIIQ
jgi:alpha-L-rhamnosidase